MAIDEHDDESSKKISLSNEIKDCFERMEEQNLQEWVGIFGSSVGPMYPECMDRPSQRTMWESSSFMSTEDLINHIVDSCGTFDTQLRFLEGGLLVYINLSNGAPRRKYVVVRTAKNSYSAYLAWSR